MESRALLEPEVQDQDQEIETPSESPVMNPNQFPTSVYFIIGQEFCERFSFYGMKTILFVYLREHWRLSESTTTSAVHGFVMLAYFFPLLGGTLSDSYWGKYRTILYLSWLYCLGNLVLSLTALLGPPDQVPWGPAVGLVLLAIGTGGIKPCVSAFGGDQFAPGADPTALQRFFSLFYFSINAGSVLSTFLTPELRSLSCLGRDSCYPVAFGVPAVLMLVATLIFMAGSKMYRRNPPGGNVWIKIGQVARRAVQVRKEGRRAASGREESVFKRAWRSVVQWPGNIKAVWSVFWGSLDPALRTPSVLEVRAVFGVLTMFLPLPFFWALYDQTASRWVGQAQEMGVNLTLFGTQIQLKPEQMQLTNALLILLMIPLFERGIYPLVRAMHLSFRPLKRMAVGMVLVGVAFGMAAMVQFRIDSQSVIEREPRTRCVENCVSILWQVPQYVVLTAGEILFSVTGLEFAYSQAPASMKSLCQATWLLTVAVGNLLVMIIASLQLFESKAYEFIFYSILVVVAALVFAAMAMRYHYVEDRDVPVNDVDEEDEEVVDTDVSVGVDEDVAPETALLASDAKED